MTRPKSVSLPGAVEYTGIPRTTLVERIKSGELRYALFGKSVKKPRYVIRLDDLDELVDRHLVPEKKDAAT